MSHLRILTAGESHGMALMGILEGMPGGLKLDLDKINTHLARRQKGYGRGGRMSIETDKAEIVSGVRFGITSGGPIGVRVENKDWENWQTRMGIWKGEDEPVVIPRPGHADLAGAIKYDHEDIRNVLERASARETAMRVAIGSIIRQLVELLGIQIASHVIQIQQVKTEHTFLDLCDPMTSETKDKILTLAADAEASEIRCADKACEAPMIRTIQVAQKQGDTVGGIFEVAAVGCPVGLGSHVAWDRRLDSALAAAFMGIPAIKAVEIGLGTECGTRLGSEVHDAILPGQKHDTNRAGGIEGGMSNGEPILIRATMKPIPTLTRPLPSINLKTGDSVDAHKERSDVCAVPAASIVGEAMMAIVIGQAIVEKFGGDSITQLERHFNSGR